jgi:hypothetical protein
MVCWENSFNWLFFNLWQTVCCRNMQSEFFYFLISWSYTWDNWLFLRNKVLVKKVYIISSLSHWKLPFVVNVEAASWDVRIRTTRWNSLDPLVTEWKTVDFESHLRIELCSVKSIKHLGNLLYIIASYILTQSHTPCSYWNVFKNIPNERALMKFL